MSSACLPLPLDLEQAKQQQVVHKGFDSLLQVGFKSHFSRFALPPADIARQLLDNFTVGSSLDNFSETEEGNVSVNGTLPSWVHIRSPRSHAAWLALGAFSLLLLALIWGQCGAARRKRERARASQATPSGSQSNSHEVRRRSSLAIRSRTASSISEGSGSAPPSPIAHLASRRQMSTRPSMRRMHSSSSGNFSAQARVRLHPRFADGDDPLAALVGRRTSARRPSTTDPSGGRSPDSGQEDDVLATMTDCASYDPCKSGSVKDPDERSRSIAEDEDSFSSSEDWETDEVMELPDFDDDARYSAQSVAIANSSKFFMGRTSTMADDESEDIDYTCDYVLVFPLRGSKTKEMHWSGTNMVIIDWEAQVNGLELARKVFLETRGHPLASQEDLEERFGDGRQISMTEYHTQVRKLLAELLVGPALGLYATATASEGENDVFLKLTLPRFEDDCLRALHEYAAALRYRMPLSLKAYQDAGVERPTNRQGAEVPGYAEFNSSCAEYFDHFKQLDIIRLLISRLNQHFNIYELENQGVLVEHFPAHNRDEALQLRLLGSWANTNLWYQLPDERMDDRIKDYFGEEVAWTFAWQHYFTLALVFPALLGGLVFLRRFFLRHAIQMWIQLGYAGVMIVWLTGFTSCWDRREARIKQVWGMDQGLQSMTVSSRWQKDDSDSSVFVIFIKVMGDIGALLVLITSAVATFYISRARQQFIGIHPEMASVISLAAAVTTSAQILAVDFVWRYVSRYLTEMENHKYQEQWNAAWVERCFWPRLFTNIYPFVYLGFFKKHVDSCPNTPQGCLEELEMNLATHFMSRVISQMASDLLLIAYVNFNMWLERIKCGNRRPRPAVEVQAKSFAYDETFTLNEWTEQTLTFAYVTCFSLVLPAISGIALLSNMFESRLVAHRDLMLLRRPLPQYAAGIGIWRKLLNAAALLAVLINVGFAIFVFKPLCDHPSHLKWAYFVLAEKGISMIRLTVHAKFPRVPQDVDEAAEKNKEVIRRIFSKVVQNSMDLLARQVVPDITPDAFRQQDSAGGTQAGDQSPAEVANSGFLARLSSSAALTMIGVFLGAVAGVVFCIWLYMFVQGSAAAAAAETLRRKLVVAAQY